jgi:hypothetical protein
MCTSITPASTSTKSLEARVIAVDQGVRSYEVDGLDPSPITKKDCFLLGGREAVAKLLVQRCLLPVHP